MGILIIQCVFVDEQTSKYVLSEFIYKLQVLFFVKIRWKLYPMLPITFKWEVRLKCIYLELHPIQRFTYKVNKNSLYREIIVQLDLIIFSTFTFQFKTS